MLILSGVNPNVAVNSQDVEREATHIVSGLCTLRLRAGCSSSAARMDSERKWQRELDLINFALSFDNEEFLGDEHLDQLCNEPSAT
jgi:hypothetical protein